VAKDFVGGSVPGKRQERFDEVALRVMASDLTFARGRTYCDNGKVELVAIEAAEIVARVLGAEVYRTKLKGSGKRFAGECSCPAFADRGFCKHLVATALAANGLSSDAAEEIGNRFSRIRDHLRAQGVEALVEKLMALAERDGALFCDLELAAATAREDDKSVLNKRPHVPTRCRLPQVRKVVQQHEYSRFARPPSSSRAARRGTVEKLMDRRNAVERTHLRRVTPSSVSAVRGRACDGWPSALPAEGLRIDRARGRFLALAARSQR
jgi:hypothetical protein